MSLCPSCKAPSPSDDVRVGDIREGTGRYRVLVDVLRVDGSIAHVRLRRYGKEASISVRTLEGYRVLGRNGALELSPSPDPRKGMNQTHGQANTPEYTAWEHMVQRCTNPKAQQYHDYGGRGITLCREWRESFEAFLRDVGPRPSSLHTLDRPNNDDGYHPGNIRWATRREQQLNRRVNNRIEHEGRVQTLTEWAEELGVNRETLRLRIARGETVGDTIARTQR